MAQEKQCMIFAAGLGTRLKPLTDTMPKALVPVNGKPLLEYVLRKLKAAGFTKAVINVYHFAEQIINFVNQNDFGMEVSISDEREMLLDTGGGVKKAQTLLNTEQPFLIHNVDILSDLDLNQFYAAHTPDRLATILVSNRKSNRYFLFDDNNRLVGWRNVQTGEIKTPYAHLDVAKCKHLAFAGIHTISPDIFKLMTDWEGKFSIIDFYISMADRHLIYGHEPSDIQIIDVGKLDALHEAEKFVKNK